MRVLIVGFAIFIALIALATHTAAGPANCDPVYEEWTDKADCDENCQNICSPVEDACLCRFGYLRDLTTGKCIPSDQCTPAPENVKLTCLGA
ncbi:chymotrypsin inhibitor Ani s 6-like [Anopheles stephensi]|nr:chymotrypsin inhibitor Ani s 6-like [Anopheles stephensi]